MEYLNDIAEQTSKMSGLNVSILEPGTKLQVQTRNSFYDIIIEEAKQVKIFGGMKRDGSIRFPQPVTAIIHGATWGGTSILVDRICHKMRMEFSISNKLGFYTTSTVQNITLEAPDGSWYYSMGWQD